jgi:hypothetical protein
MLKQGQVSDDSEVVGWDRIGQCGQGVAGGGAS